MLEVVDYLKAGYPIIWMQEKDEVSAINKLKKIASNGKTKKSGSLKFNVWSCTEGIKIYNHNEEKVTVQANTKDPIQALEWLISKGVDSSLNVFLNMHPYMEQSQVQQLLKDSIPLGKNLERHIIIVSTEIKIPSTLEKDIALISYNLPTKEELEVVLDDLIRLNSFEQVKDKSRILDAALGLTLSEAENAFSMAVVKHKEFSEDAIQTVQQLKTQYIGKDGILTYIPPKISMDDIAGLEVLKEWLYSREQAMSIEARDYGLPIPKGILLAGVPGSGKSLSAKAVSAAWQLPLLQFDISQVFGSLVGESEQKMKTALSTAEAVSPCILWLDEIEKAFSGMNGNSDSGVTSRVFGQFLTWMQEKSKMVFVIATANNVESLPPEFLRKGRFDEFFWVDLPTNYERKKIFELHIKKIKRNPDNFDIDLLAKETLGFSGAEIEEIVKSSLFSSFEDKRELEMKDLVRSLNSITPLSITMKERIEGIREWAKDRARNASNVEPTDEVELANVKARSDRIIHID